MTLRRVLLLGVGAPFAAQNGIDSFRAIAFVRVLLPN